TLRIIILSSGGAGLVLGAAALPFLGFGLGGITAGSIAAGMQGPTVVAGGVFATLQSLGATGMGILLFGSLGTALGLLAPLASRLGWCNGCPGNTAVDNNDGSNDNHDDSNNDGSNDD
ncbi:hypothetical protein HK103_004301, partial [Boothiomyces macroporosus]